MVRIGLNQEKSRESDIEWWFEDIQDETYYKKYDELDQLLEWAVKSWKNIEKKYVKLVESVYQTNL